MPSAIGKKVIATQSYIASHVGAKVLENGGNAFDAAIAASAVLSVVMPFTSGLGGDGFLMARTPEGIIVYNASSISPKGLTVEAIPSERSPLTVLVPGLADLWDFMYNNFSTEPLDNLLNPAIKLAENGFFVNRSLHHAIVSSSKMSQEWDSIYAGRRFGDSIKLRGMAMVMRKISKDPRLFYEGKIAEELVEGLKRNGVPIDFTDFSEFHGEVARPIKTNYKDFQLYEIPPNSQGITTLELLKMIELADINRMPFNDVSRVNEHLRLSALAYEDRNKFVTDPNFYKVPDGILDKSYLSRKLIENGIDVKVRDGDTTFLVVSDGENDVGMIQSLFYPFGSGIVVNDITFNNRGAGFTDGINAPKPKKRPLHTLSILIAEKGEGEEKLIIGCAGGDLRPQIHSQVFEYYADYNMEIDEAVSAPRFMYLGNKVIAEKRLGIPATPTDYMSPEVGIVQALKVVKNQKRIGVADPRGEGIALPV
ncbi:gamma-glutamyltransferase family protein [Sulfuracidifex metallicus]|uniref:gamma-glutamyltransferase family protein n=1 Tax=Sulfuracidifex metallicus TaxID=47303 RepID=UPI002273015E|nr:gamma-glutamyltransferase [Sulfuracidifex metallicus]MCY0850730.1 gamma-glutamyltransferase [Sulfuracidifex metallicus]